MILLPTLTTDAVVLFGCSEHILILLALVFMCFIFNPFEDRTDNVIQMTFFTFALISASNAMAFKTLVQVKVRDSTLKDVGFELWSTILDSLFLLLAIVGISVYVLYQVRETARSLRPSISKLTFPQSWRCLPQSWRRLP